MITENLDSRNILRQGDKILNVVFVKGFNKKMVSNGEWQAVNRRRLYLKVLTVADIATGNGLDLNFNFWFGKNK